jgi:DNA-binding beta-propeller fold protein YncE
VRSFPAALLATVLLVAACGPDPVEEPARLLVASGFTDQVFVLDPVDGTLLDSLAVHSRPVARDEPHGITVAPDGRRWYLTLAHGEPLLRVYERPGNRLVGELALPMGGASRIGLTPDGRIAFVADYGRSAGDEPGEVARIRTRSLEITHREAVCPAPHDARVDPSGERLLVTCAFGSEALLLSAADLSILARIPLPGEGDHGFISGDRPPGSLPGEGEHGSMPMNATWSPDGSRAWITLMAADAVVEIDREGAVQATIPAGPGPVSPLVTPDGSRLLVTERGGASLAIFRLPALELERRVDLGHAPHPQGLALDGEGRVAFVGYEGEVGGAGGVVAVAIDDGSIRWRREVGAYVLGVAWLTPLPLPQPPAEAPPN